MLSGALFFFIERKTDFPVDQTKTSSRETLEIEKIKPMETFSINTSFEMEKDKRLLGLNILEDNKSILRKKLRKYYFFALYR